MKSIKSLTFEKNWPYSLPTGYEDYQDYQRTLDKVPILEPKPCEGIQIYRILKDDESEGEEKPKAPISLSHKFAFKDYQQLPQINKSDLEVIKSVDEGEFEDSSHRHSESLFRRGSTLNSKFKATSPSSFYHYSRAQKEKMGSFASSIKDAGSLVSPTILGSQSTQPIFQGKPSLISNRNDQKLPISSWKDLSGSSSHIDI